MKAYKVYILDFDGTLVDSAPSLFEPFKKALNAIDISPKSEEIDNAIHFALSQTLHHFGVDEPERQKMFVNVFHEEYAKEKYLKLIKTYAEVPSFLEEGKKRGFRFGLVSGNDVPHIRKILGRFGLDGYFETFVGGSPDRRPKPFPDPLYEAFKSFPGVDKKDMVYVGDSLQDIQCAKNANIDGILLERKGEYADIPEKKIHNLLELFN